MAKRVAASKAKVSAQEQMARACERAAASGLTIVGRGWRVADGALAWEVPSQSEPGKRHRVVLCNDRLTCECRGSHEFGIVCIHQGVILNELAAEARSFAAAQRRLAATTSTVTPAAAGVHPGATAMLYRDNAPVSIWRA